MSVVLGVDVGGSTTKIVGLCNDECVGMLQVRAADQITSMYGAIGSFMSKHKLRLDNVTSIYLTGVGASFINEQVYDIETIKISEFDAIGYGALNMTGLDEALVVSMGTGTAFVKATKEKNTHLGGSGVGGGTILGIASLLFGKTNIDAILALADKGNLNNIDLTVSDILSKEVGTLPADLTAANFGKVKSTASESDIALGIINMVFETIGMLSVFALKNDPIKNVILTGTLATFPQAKTIFNEFKNLTGLNYIIPENAVFYPPALFSEFR